MNMGLKEDINLLFAAEDGNDVEQAFFRSRFTDDTTWDEGVVTKFKAKLKYHEINFEYEARFGGEGCGDDYWSVYSFSKGNEKVFVQFDGWYQSYNGSEYSEWFFVEPKEVTVTEYYKVT